MYHKPINMLAVIVTVLLSACSSQAIKHPHKNESNNLLMATKIGSITFGDSLSKAASLLNENIASQIHNQACTMVSFKAYPHIKFMVEDGIITRADASKGISNQLGIVIGESLQQILKRYPQAQIERHKYIIGGFYLTFPSHDNRSAVVAEVIDNKVMFIRAGLQPSVSYVEQCH